MAEVEHGYINFKKCREAGSTAEKTDADVTFALMLDESEIIDRVEK